MGSNKEGVNPVEIYWLCAFTCSLRAARSGSKDYVLSSGVLHLAHDMRQYSKLFFGKLENDINAELIIFIKHSWMFYHKFN